MNKKELEAFAREAALNAELNEHLGYDRHQPSGNANSRNGYTSKTLKTEDG